MVITEFIEVDNDSSKQKDENMCSSEIKHEHEG